MSAKINRDNKIFFNYDVIRLMSGSLQYVTIRRATTAMNQQTRTDTHQFVVNMPAIKKLTKLDRNYNETDFHEYNNKIEVVSVIVSYSLNVHMMTHLTIIRYGCNAITVKM